MRQILESFGFNPDTGKYPGPVLPAAYQNDVCEMITIDPARVMEGITPGWAAEETAPAVLASEETEDHSDDKEADTSLPDVEEFQINRKRRGKRTEVPCDEKEEKCKSFARWFNSVSRHQYYGIIHEQTIERDASDVVYVSIDAVYVNKQVGTREVAGIGKDQQQDGRKETGSRRVGSSGIDSEEKEKRIGHMNVKVEWDCDSYYITSTDTSETFRELIAVIMQNKLYTKYMIFLTDGEQAINDKIREYCGIWKYHVELDWIHLENKCYDRLSNALKGKRVPDPRGNIEYYKRGPKKGQIRNQDHTSQSRLYARALTRILWAGNVDEAISYLEHIDPSVIKNIGELNQLITYLKNKKDWIPSYALRKRAGLRNSSNGVEGQNNMNVANRQKHNGTSWRPEGSSYLASLKTLFDNGEDEAWFYNNTVNFIMFHATDEQCF